MERKAQLRYRFDQSKTTGPRKKRLRLSRRSFVKAAGAATTVVTTGLGTSAFGSTDLPKVSEDDPMAKALGYVHDARKVDAAQRLSNRFCNNCALYAGDADNEWAKCSIFPGKVVAGEGWCRSWIPKQES